MKVWVMTSGMYSDRGVAGVYATVEAAIANNPAGKDCRPRNKQHRHTWERNEWRVGKEVFYGWDNGCDWQGYLELEEFEVVGEPANAE